MTFFDLPDGVFDPDLLDEARLVRSGQGGGRYRERPALKRSATVLAAELVQQGRITNRDYQIFETLYGAAPILSRHQIQRLFWGNSTARTVGRIVSNRLGTLVYPYYALNHNPNASVALAGAGLEPCYVYYLDAVGIKLLAEQRRRSGRTFRPPQNIYNALAAPILLLHDLMVHEVFTQVTLRTRGDSRVRFRWVIQWQSIIRDQAGNEMVRPDATIVLHEPETNVTRHYFLELDRDHNTRRWPERVQRYENALSAGQWRGKFGMRSFPTVLVVSQHVGPERIAAIVRKQSQATSWLFKEWSSLLPAGNDILAGWHNKHGEAASLIAAENPIFDNPAIAL
jgi:hypothetical protein